MKHWPPSPCVEDEATALSHEQSTGTSISSLKTDDDDPAPHRGAIDQYPIIVDSDDPDKAKLRKAVPAKAASQRAKTASLSSDDNIEPLTPSSSEEEKRSTPQLKSVSFHDDPISDSKTTISVDEKLAARGRPKLPAIETTLGADLLSMATGARRTPSPYTYSRPTALEQPHTRTSGTLSEPYARSSTPSPVQTRIMGSATTPTDGYDAIKHSRRHTNRSSSRRRVSDESRQRESSSDGEKRHRRSHTNERDRQSKSRHHAAQSDEHDKTDKYERSRKPRVDTLTPPQSRRESRDLAYRVDTEEPRPKHGSTRDLSSPHQSPYTSSAEDATRRSRHRSSRNERPSDTQSRRPSTHRRERPRMDDLADRLRNGKSVLPELDTNARRSKHGSRVDPLTPVTADPKTMEDYFAKAFQDHDKKKSSRATRPHHSASTLTSPFTSPPRTPTSERYSKDYFSLHSSNLPSSPRSRTPGADSSRLETAKAHSTLLSAATAGAALVAGARIASEAHKPSKSTLTGDTPSVAAKTSHGTQSLRTSPVIDDHHGAPYTTGLIKDSSHKPDPSQLNSSCSRPAPKTITHVSERSPAQPQRAFSYSGHEQSRKFSYGPYGSPGDASRVFHSTFYSTQPSTPTVPSPAPRSGNGTIARPQATPASTLPLCPRFRPVAGLHDWYSIKEMSHLDFCPTCMVFLSKTRFRELFVPSLSRPFNEPSVCAMSKPWLRVALVQSLKQNRSNLDLMDAVSTLPGGTRPCSGSKADTRVWYDIIDPMTHDPIPNFVACSACARKVDCVFPELDALIDKSRRPLNQERICCMHPNSKHFPALVEQFDLTARRCRERAMASKDTAWRDVDIFPLVDFLRKIFRYGSCPRDCLLPSRAWHFMPDLPDLTICEECYDEVVWPLGDMPVARDVTKTTKLVPVRKNSPPGAGISCQLYSERMRQLFRDAVMSKSLTQLRDVVQTRCAAQQRLAEMNKLYEQDQKAGIDRRAEIEKNNSIWHSME